jgi:branched-subunit amino acid ABC-type transport system permease component
MDYSLPILIVILFFAGWAAFAISRVVYKRLDKAGSPDANVLRIVTMIVSFLLIIGVIWFMFIASLHIEC